jgi:hypothetical protein
MTMIVDSRAQLLVIVEEAPAQDLVSRIVTIKGDITQRLQQSAEEEKQLWAWAVRHNKAKTRVIPSSLSRNLLCQNQLFSPYEEFALLKRPSKPAKILERKRRSNILDGFIVKLCDASESF